MVFDQEDGLAFFLQCSGCFFRLKVHLLQYTLDLRANYDCFSLLLFKSLLGLWIKISLKGYF